MYVYIPQLLEYHLSPFIFDATSLISELLCTFFRVDASRKTSWLSLHPHLFYHLVVSYGPWLVIRAVSVLTMKLIPHCLTT